MPRKKVDLTEQVTVLYPYWSKTEPIPNDLWIIDQICHCKSWGYSGFREHISAEKTMGDPPKCSTCHKLQNRLFLCCMCNEWFYYWFKHSRQGWHQKPRVGWYCWNCCERYYPAVVEPNATKRFGFVPPPDEVLPPGYELFVRKRTSGNRGPAT